MITERHTDGSQTESSELSSSGGNEPPPAFMYIHYLKHEELNADEETPCPVYLFQIANPSKLTEEITQAIQDIYDNKATPVKPGANGVEWRAYSYAVFAFESTNEKIEKVDFKHKITGGNKTFSDGKFINEFNYKSRLFSAAYYTNLRKHNDGTSLGNRSDIVEWKAHHKAKGGPGSIVTHQGSDPNTGP